IAGNPPAAVAQRSGMKGIIETVARNVKTDPAAPSAPNFLFQYPNRIRLPKVHSDTPRNQLAPRMRTPGYSHDTSGLLLIKGIRAFASYSNHFWYPKKKYMITIDARSN